MMHLKGFIPNNIYWLIDLFKDSNNRVADTVIIFLLSVFKPKTVTLKVYNISQLYCFTVKMQYQ